MEGYASLSVGPIELQSAKSEWDPIVMTLFTEADRVIFLHKDDEESYDEDPEWHLSYSAPLKVIKDRLEVMGFTYKRADELYRAALSEEIGNIRRSIIDPVIGLQDDEVEERKVELATLEDLTLEKWIESIRYIIENDLQPNWEYKDNKDNKYDHIPPHTRYILSRVGDTFFGNKIVELRTYLRAIAEVSDLNVELVYDLSELIINGNVSVEDDLHEIARLTVAAEFAVNHKIVVLTEGSSDIRAIQGALQLFYPHLTEYFSFMDFDAAKAHGSAGHLASTVKSFIGAGIVNRTVALFDNDTAAKDAIRPLDDIKIPPNMKVLRYPDLDLARDYPTLGPQGTVSMDVNGLACSLELYFGLDVLQDVNGSLYPIQWKGYIDGVKQYQGEVMEKKMLHARYAEKLEKCLADPKQINNYDWSGMRLILDRLRSAFNGD